MGSQLLAYIPGFNLGLQVIKFYPLITNVCNVHHVHALNNHMSVYLINDDSH